MAFQDPLTTGVALLFVLASLLIAGMRDELPFRVELWDEGFNRLLETLAAAGDFLTAKAAYEAAIKRRPGEPNLCASLYTRRVTEREHSMSPGARCRAMSGSLANAGNDVHDLPGTGVNNHEVIAPQEVIERTAATTMPAGSG